VDCTTMLEQTKGYWCFFSIIVFLILQHVGAAPPPEFEALECAIKQFAYDFGSQHVHTNLGALHDALYFANCSGDSRKVGHVLLPQKQPYKLRIPPGDL
jgi:hypothetical protein